jgi:hypothetical protein|tara:strand:+ start:262 stop:783 length:522 start_codon:yes stop_codon:yes gene_type:complete
MKKPSKKTSQKSLAPPETMVETKERSQHSPVVDMAVKATSGKGVRKVRRVLYEHVLDVLLHRSLINYSQHEAGIRVRHFGEMAQLHSRVIARYDQSSGEQAGPEAEAHAREMIRDALDGLNRREKSVLIGTCVYGEWPGVWAIRRGWKVNKSPPIDSLRIALADVARRWRISQ